MPMQRRTLIQVIPALALLGCATEPSRQPSGGLRFSEAERSRIGEYYTCQRGRGPIEIPAQTVKAGEKLTQGPRRRRLPRELEETLPPLSAPYMRLIVGADVVLVNTDTDDILDVIARVAY
jgi:hypothetical protein